MERIKNRSDSTRSMIHTGARQRSVLASAIRVVLPYLILGSAWILFSDQLLLTFADDPRVMIAMSTFKGWLYVLITGILLFVLILNELRRQAALEAKLRDGLNEKSTLLFELSHRVKNNLQVLASILSLETEDIEGEEVRALNNRTKARIRALSLAHERLFDAGVIARIDFGEYIRTLWVVLLEIFEAKDIDISFSLDEIFIGSTEAPSLGLFSVEAMSNAMLYGACADGSCRVSITLRKDRDGLVELIIRDEGRGIEADAEGLGLRLMDALAHQLNGKVERYNDPGVVVRLRFPLP
jgi:two-component sensor histidine kinase